MNMVIKKSELKTIYELKDDLSDSQWEKFYGLVRDKVISDLTVDELRTKNPNLYRKIAEEVAKYISIEQEIESFAPRKKTIENPYMPYVKRREIKVGDSIIYEGMPLYVVGWRGNKLIVKDKFGNSGEIINDPTKYVIQ